MAVQPPGGYNSEGWKHGAADATGSPSPPMVRESVGKFISLLSFWWDNSLELCYLWCLWRSPTGLSSVYITLLTATAKSLQSCPTLGSHRWQPSRLPVPGILQARTLEWVAISFSNAWKWKVKVKLLSRVWLLATPWTAAHQAPRSMGFSRQEHWSGVPLPSLFASFSPFPDSLSLTSSLFPPGNFSPVNDYIQALASGECFQENTD